MCRRLLDAGTPGLHLYTLNLESAVVGILEQLGLLNKSQVRRPAAAAVAFLACQAGLLSLA